MRRFGAGLMKIYKAFIDPKAFDWPAATGPLDRSYRPEVPDLARANDRKVMVTRLENDPVFFDLKDRIFQQFSVYAEEFGYQVHSLAMVGYSEFGKGATLPWHTDWYGGYHDDRVLTMSIQIQRAQLGGGLQFPGSEIIQLDDGDAVIFDSRVRHRSVRVVSGIRKIVVSFACGVKT